MSCMDIACAPCVRASYLEAVQHPFFILGDYGASSAHSTLNYICWVNSRRLRVFKLKLHASSIVSLATVHARALERVEELDLRECPLDMKLTLKEAYHKIFTNCASVKRIRAMDGHLMDSLCAELNTCSEHLPVTSVTCAVHRTGVSHVMDAFHRTIDALVVTFNEERGERMPTLTAHWRRLKKLGLINCDLSLQDINNILDQLPLLVDLEFYPANHLFAFKARFSLEEITTLVPRFRHMQRLCFSCAHGGLGMKVFPIIMAACPVMQELDVDLVKFRIIPGGCHFSASSILFNTADAQSASTCFANCIEALPVLIADLHLCGYYHLSAANVQLLARKGASLSKLHWEMHAAISDSEYIRAYKSFPKLTSLEPSGRVGLSDKRLLDAMKYCPNLTNLSLRNCSAITDAALARALEFYGAKLKVLVVHTCKKASVLTLKAIVKHCPDLVHLCLQSNAQQPEQVRDIIIVPDRLKKLSRLGMSSVMLKKIVRSGVELPLRWRKVMCFAWYKGEEEEEEGSEM